MLEVRGRRRFQLLREYLWLLESPNPNNFKRGAGGDPGGPPPDPPASPAPT